MNDDPDGYIEVDGEYMGFWLPPGVDPDELGINVMQRGFAHD